MVPSTLRSCLALAAGLVVIGCPTPSLATYSIAAFDRDTGRFGAATASCVPLEVMQMVYAQVPGVGAVLTQSYLLPDGAARALALDALAEPRPAADVLASLTDPAFDPDFELRQYAVLDPSGGVAAFTGAMAEPYAAHMIFSHDAFEVVVTGNFLTGEEVLLDARDAFQEQACDLEARLMNALLAASAPSQGDARCVAEGQPAQSALIHVGRDDGDVTLEVGQPSPPPDDPVKLLAAELAAWRTEHPCPTNEGPTDEGPTDESPTDESPTTTESGCTIAAPSRTTHPWLLTLAILFAPFRRFGRRSAGHKRLFEPQRRLNRRKAPNKSPSAPRAAPHPPSASRSATTARARPSTRGSRSRR